MLDRNELSEIGRTIRQRRIALGLSQRRLCDLARISLGCLRDIEQGRTRFPRANSLAALELALEPPVPASDHLPHPACFTAFGDDEGPGFRWPAGQADHGQIRILGPLCVVWRGAPMEIRWRRDRIVLALLALRGELGVSPGELTDLFWPGRRPSSAMTILQGHVSRIRQLLRSATSTPGSEPLAWDGRVYRLGHGTQRQLDSIQFATLAEHGDAAASAGDPRQACECYGGALRLWRGEALADLDLGWHPSVVLLNLSRSRVIMRYADAAASIGRHELALPQLRQASLDEPLSEAIHQRLIVALAGSGQRAEAVQVFEKFRQRLEHDLGIAPGRRIWRAYSEALNE